VLPPVAPLSPILGPDGLSELDIVRRLHDLGQPGLTLAEFVAAAWSIVVPEKLHWSWHMQVVCDHLQAQLERGRFGKPRCNRLVINVPPGSSKSLLQNVFAVSWMWLWDPSWSVICASANPRIVLRDSVKCRDVLASRWYQDTFKPRWRLADDQNVKGAYKTTAGGSRVSFGAGSSKITGEHAAALFFDDLLDAAEAPTKSARDSINAWLDFAAGNRLNNLSEDTITMIAQRLHEEDPPGHVLEKGDWEHLRIDMEFGVEPECECAACSRGQTFLGWKDPRTVVGEVLDSVRFPDEVLKSERRRLGSAGYAGQMNQAPMAAQGNIFHADWWRFYTRDNVAHPRPKGATQLPARLVPIDFRWLAAIGSWDCSFKDLESSDLVCGGVIAKVGADLFVLDLFWERAGFMRTCEAVKKMRADWPMARTILIEDKANGTAVIEVMKTQIPGVVAVEPKGGKEARAVAGVPTVEGGNVYLPEGAPWLEDWFKEFGSFPRGKHDDAVDMLSQAIMRFTGTLESARAAALLGQR
jgi:predicted phage terminase large subunit-like protein